MQWSDGGERLEGEDGNTLGWWKERQSVCERITRRTKKIDEEMWSLVLSDVCATMPLNGLSACWS